LFLSNAAFGPCHVGCFFRPGFLFPPQGSQAIGSYLFPFFLMLQTPLSAELLPPFFRTEFLLLFSVLPLSSFLLVCRGTFSLPAFLTPSWAGKIVRVCRVHAFVFYPGSKTSFLPQKNLSVLFFPGPVSPLLPQRCLWLPSFS